MSRLGTETAFEVLNKARALERQGKNIIHLEIGEPDFDTPKNVIDAGVNALHQGWTHYGPSAGLPELRQAVAKEVIVSRGVEVSPDEVVVVPGGKPIIFFTVLALAEQGDEVIYPNPGFPIYESMIHYVGAKPVPIRLREDRDFRFDVDEFASLINDRTRLIILNSPHNPTGGVLSKQDIRDIAEVIGDRNLMVLSDEIYSRLIFDGEHYSIMSVAGFQERTINSDGVDYHWYEYLLFNPYAGYRYLTEYSGHWNDVTVCHALPVRSTVTRSNCATLVTRSSTEIDRSSATVTRLTDFAPASLMSRPWGMPGITIDTSTPDPCSSL